MSVSWILLTDDTMELVAGRFSCIHHDLLILLQSAWPRADFVDNTDASSCSSAGARAGGEDPYNAPSFPTYSPFRGGSGPRGPPLIAKIHQSCEESMSTKSKRKTSKKRGVDMVVLAVATMSGERRYMKYNRKLSPSRCHL